MIDIVRHSYKKPHLDTDWLIECFVREVRSASVRLPERVLRVRMNVWSVLTPVQQKDVRRVAHEVKVRVEIVP